MHLGVLMCMCESKHDGDLETTINILRMRNDAESILKS